VSSTPDLDLDLSSPPSLVHIILRLPHQRCRHLTGASQFTLIWRSLASETAFTTHVLGWPADACRGYTATGLRH